MPVDFRDFSSSAGLFSRDDFSEIGCHALVFLDGVDVENAGAVADEGPA
jgi:hypothetical protein